MAERYGPNCWGIVYQADVRMRSEEVPRILRRLEREHAAAVAAGGTHVFDPDKPWELVWATAVKQHDWWLKEVKEPALLYLAHARSLSALVDDDTRTGAKEKAGRSGGSEDPRPSKKRKGARGGGAGGS